MSTSVFIAQVESPDDGADSSPWISGRRNGRASRRLSVGRRRSVPHLALGALLIVGCATGFAIAATSLDHRRTVLALAHPVAVGEVLTAGDLRDVQVVTGAGMDSIPSSASSTVVGQPMAMSLPAGALLTSAELGSAATPAAGKAIVAELVKPGQFPPDVAAGAHVLLITTAAAVTGSTVAPGAAVPGAAGSSWSATVLGVEMLDNGQGTVLTVQVAAGEAPQLAAVAPGDLDVVSVAVGGR